MPRPSPKHLEIELILCCSRVFMDAATAERVRTIIRSQPDWDFVLQTSLKHGVDVLLYHSLSRVSSKELPAGVHNRLSDQVHNNVVKCLFLTAQLLKLLEVFQRNGIDAIPFKGPVLAVLAYGDVTLRRFGDLDILIRKKDFAKTKELLSRQGFRPWCDLTALEEAAHVASEHAYTFVSKDNKLSIDLHWDLLQRRFALFETDALWSRLAPVSIAGREIFSLGAEDLLLYLCLHNAKHEWNRLAWISDVAALVRAQPQIEWNLLWKTAERLDCRRVLLLGLSLAKKTVGIDLPEVIANRIDHRTSATAVRLKNRLFAERLPYLEIIKQIVLYSRIRERWRDQIPYFRHVLHRLLHPRENDRDLVPLPPRFAYLHYLFRPLRLIAIAAWQTVSSVFGRTLRTHRSRPKS